eukprot:jgi/Mesvir1/12414/Mv00582-RA.1
MSSGKKGGYDWFEDLVNSQHGSKNVKTSKSLAPSTVVRHVGSSDDEEEEYEDTGFEEEKKAPVGPAPSKEREEKRQADDRDDSVKRYVRTTYRTDPSSVRHPGLKDVLVQSLRVRPQRLVPRGTRTAGYLNDHGGVMTELPPRDVLRACDCELLADDIAEHKVSLAVEFSVGKAHYAVTYSLDGPVTFPPLWLTRVGDEDPLPRLAFQRGALSSVVLSAILTDDEGRETDVTTDVVACQGPDKDFYEFAGVSQYAWCVIRYLEIKHQNRQALRLIGKRPTCGVVHPRLAVSEDGEDCLEYVSDSSPEPKRSLRIIFGDGDAVEYTNADKKVID